MPVPGLRIRSWIKSYSQRIFVFRNNVAGSGGVPVYDIFLFPGNTILSAEGEPVQFHRKVAWNLNPSAEILVIVRNEQYGEIACAS